MKNKPDNSEAVKNYYRDCGKGLKENDPRIYINRIRNFPSFLYQTNRINETIPEIKKLLKPKSKLLDIACGSGYVLSVLPKGSYGIDINPRHVKAASANAPNAKIIEGDIKKTPFKPGFFDLILAMEIFEHIPDGNLVIDEVWRILKPHGVFLVTVPSENFLWKLRFLASSMYVTEPMCNSFSKKSLLSLFGKHKFRIKKFKKFAWGLNYLLVVEKIGK